MLNDSRDVAGPLTDLKTPTMEQLPQTIDEIPCFLHCECCRDSYPHRTTARHNRKDGLTHFCPGRAALQQHVLPLNGKSYHLALRTVPVVPATAHWRISKSVSGPKRDRECLCIISNMLTSRKRNVPWLTVKLCPLQVIRQKHRIEVYIHKCADFTEFLILNNSVLLLVLQNDFLVWSFSKLVH